MKLYLGTGVVLRDGSSAGHLERLAVDPRQRRILGLVVHRGSHIGHDVLASLELATVDEAGIVHLRIRPGQVDRLPGLHEGEERGANTLRMPHIPELPAPLTWPIHSSYAQPPGERHANLPGGSVELSDSTAVYATDGLVGTLAGVQLGAHDGAIDDLIVRVGTLLRKDILIPAAWATAMDGVQIQLDRSKHAVKQRAQHLPPPGASSREAG